MVAVYKNSVSGDLSRALETTDDQASHRAVARGQYQAAGIDGGGPAQLNRQRGVESVRIAVRTRSRLGVAVDQDGVGNCRQGRGRADRARSRGECSDLVVGQGAVEDGQLV